MIGFGTGSSRSASASDLDDHSNNSSTIIGGREKESEQVSLPTFGGLPENTVEKPTSSIMKSQVGVEQEQKSHDLMLLDEISNMIRQPCQEEDLVRLIQQYKFEEARYLL